MYMRHVVDHIIGICAYVDCHQCLPVFAKWVFERFAVTSRFWPVWRTCPSST